MSRVRLMGTGVTLALVAVLVVSLVAGLGGGKGGEEAPAAEGTRAPRVRVEVLNAAGRSGLARAATERLRARGFDVVYYGNARGFSPDSSLVLDRVGREQWAERVGEAVGIEAVRTAVDSSLLVDVSVILGRDWAGAAGGAARDSADGGA